MKISVCITVKDEQRYILDLITALIQQTRKPNEIIIVDGGSRDKTFRIIRHLAKKDRSIKIVKEKGNIAHCRNVSIELSEGDIIATTDAGCIPHSTWLEKLIQPFKHKRIGLVAGYYTMPYTNGLQEAASVYIGVPPQRFDPLTFMPSTRSCAFRKSVWEDVGGFSEKLTKGGEDTEFFFRCVKNNVKIARVEDSRVEWTEIKFLNLKDISKKFFVYAKGDGQAGIWWHPTKQLSSHNIKILFVYLRYLTFLALTILCIYTYLPYHILLAIFFFYLIYPVWKWRDVIQKPKPRIWLPVIQIVSDVQIMRGFLVGLLFK